MMQTPAFLKSMAGAVKGLGEIAVSSDAVMVISGLEQYTSLIKQFPMPTLSTAGEIEIARPLGLATWQAQQFKCNQQGSVTLYETVRGEVSEMMRIIAENGNRFDATIYEGADPSMGASALLGSLTGGNWAAKYEISDAFFQLDNPDRDFESRGQAVTISGTMFFMYFGDKTMNPNRS